MVFIYVWLSNRTPIGQTLDSHIVDVQLTFFYKSCQNTIQNNYKQKYHNEKNVCCRILIKKEMEVVKEADLTANERESGCAICQEKYDDEQVFFENN